MPIECQQLWSLEKQSQQNVDFEQEIYLPDFFWLFCFLDYKLTKLRHINKTFLLLLPVESALLNFSTESLLILPTTYFPLKKTVQKVSLKHSEKPKCFNE